MVLAYARGSLKPNQPVIVVSADGKEKKGEVLKVMGHLGLERVEVEQARAGDIVCITGIDGKKIFPIPYVILQRLSHYRH